VESFVTLVASYTTKAIVPIPAVYMYIKKLQKAQGRHRFGYFSECWYRESHIFSKTGYRSDA